MEKSIKGLDIDNLRNGVFLAIRGGGIRSVSSIGVIKALEEERITIKGISGESGSSLVAGLFAYGYNSDEILDLFLKYNEAITKAAKIYGGRGAVVIEELVNKVTNGALMKNLGINCWINACKGSLLRPQLYLFSNKDTPEESLGFACAASAGLPIFYGNSYKNIDGKRIPLFDGGMLYNPYIPFDLECPLVYSSFCNSINYQRFIPFLQEPFEASAARADVVITVPVGNSIVTGSNDVIKKLSAEGYSQTVKILRSNDYF